MRLVCRNYVPLCIEGSIQKILPLYVHFLKQDLEWANDACNQPRILTEIQNLVIENIEEIERSSKSNNISYTRLSGSELISLAYQPIPTPYSTTIVSSSSNTSLQHLNQAHFSVNIFVFPKTSDLMEESLAISEL